MNSMASTYDSQVVQHFHTLEALFGYTVEQQYKSVKYSPSMIRLSATVCILYKILNLTQISIDTDFDPQ